jgi:hypothetical protein
MLILAHLVTQNWIWGNATIRLCRTVRSESAAEPARQELETIIEAARIEAEFNVIVTEASFLQVFEEVSHDATLVLLGLSVPGADDCRSYHAAMQKLLRHMPTTLLVSSTGEADLQA